MESFHSNNHMACLSRKELLLSLLCTYHYICCLGSYNKDRCSPSDDDVIYMFSSAEQQNSEKYEKPTDW